MGTKLTLLSLAFFLLSCGGGFSPSVRLRWNPVSDADLAGYRIHYGTASGVYDRGVNVGGTVTPGAPSYQIDDLEEGKTYYFAVSAYDTSGNESAKSPEIVYP